MNESEQHDIEDLLRQALQQHAGQIHPMGDGLERIRARVSRRRGTLSWLRPAAAVAGATLVVAGAMVVPGYLRHDEGGTDRTTALSVPSTVSPQFQPNRPTGPAAPLTPAEGASPLTAQPGTPDSTTTYINNDPELPDMRTVWPYGSRREGTEHADTDVANRTHPDLLDPQQTAMQFVQSFVGSVPNGDELVADGSRPMEAGIGVTISRRSGTGSRSPVSLIYLVRVRKADDSPYVVVNARVPTNVGQQEPMKIDPVRVQGTEEIEVSGSLVKQVIPGAARMKIELREPGENVTIASNALPLTDLKAEVAQDWQVPLTPTRTLASDTGTLAAWTVDVNNHLLGFVAQAADTDDN